MSIEFHFNNETTLFNDLKKTFCHRFTIKFTRITTFLVRGPKRTLHVKGNNSNLHHMQFAVKLAGVTPHVS